MPASRARSGFSAEALTALPSVGAVEEPRRAPSGDERHHDQDGQLRAGDPDARDLVHRRRSARGNRGAGHVDLG